MTSYDRRSAGGELEETKRKLVALSQQAEHEFKAGVALIEQARNTLAAARAETLKLPADTGYARSGPREALYDYTRALLEEIDKSKILQKGWLSRWFEEFTSETKAHLKDL